MEIVLGSPSTFESMRSLQNLWQTELEKVWLSEATPQHFQNAPVCPWCISYADKPLLAFFLCEKLDENYSSCRSGVVCNSSAMAAVVLP